MLAHTFRVGSSHWTTRQLAQVRHQCSRFNQWGEMGISSQKSSCLSTNHGYDLHDHLWRDLWFIGQIMVGDTNLTIRAYLYLWLCCFNPTKSTHCKENSTQEYVPRSYKKKVLAISLSNKQEVAQWQISKSSMKITSCPFWKLVLHTSITSSVFFHTGKGAAWEEK